MAILDRPFLDSHGVIGSARVRSYLNSPSPGVKPDRRIQYEVVPEEDYLLVHIPACKTKRSVRISKKNAIKLAHWLLEVAQ